MADIVEQADALLNEIQALVERQRVEHLIDNQLVIMNRCNECIRFISQNWYQFDRGNQIRVNERILGLMEEAINMNYSQGIQN